MGDLKYRKVKTGFCRKRPTQTGSSGTFIGKISGKATYVSLWDRIEVAWLWTRRCLSVAAVHSPEPEFVGQESIPQPGGQSSHIKKAIYLQYLYNVHILSGKTPFFPQRDWKSNPIWWQVEALPVFRVCFIWIIGFTGDYSVYKLGPRPPFPPPPHLPSPQQSLHRRTVYAMYLYVYAFYVFS
jgi:hypothetical protein